MKWRVLLTASGLGERLGDITKFTNKSLVRVGKKPAISYIVESYPEDIQIVVTLGHYGDHVKQFLGMAYPERKFTFVKVDRYEGDGSSLAYSILQARDHIDCPFVFHACDTIVSDPIPTPNMNWLGGHKTQNSASYVSYQVNNNQVSRLKQKGELNYDYSYIGLAGIYDWKAFFAALEQKYQESPNNTQLSDVDALRSLLEQKINFESIEFSRWQDIGNVDGLRVARENTSDRFEILDKLGESIFILTDSVIKFFHDPITCSNRVQRGKSLAGLAPLILDHTENFYKYQYASGKLFADSVTEVSFKRFLGWSVDRLWKPTEINSDAMYDRCYDFYYEKTYKRLEQYCRQTGTKDTDITINDILVPSVSSMLSQIDPRWLCTRDGHQFHGDYVADNIIETSDGFILVDWRQDFGGDLVSGDIYYDLAKLNHNLVFNHKLVNQNLYSVSFDDTKATFDILRSHNLQQCQVILNRFLMDNRFDIKKVNTLTALIWINMAPLHHYPLNNFLFYLGKLHLYKALNDNS